MYRVRLWSVRHARRLGAVYASFERLLVACDPLLRRIEDIEPFPRFWLFLAMIPIGIDWSLGVFGIWENTHLSRFLTGLILGAACGLFIVPALVEIFRNRAASRKTKRLSR